MDAKEIMERLQAPFEAFDIEWRVSRTVITKNGPRATVLAYVTNRAIMNRLDEVFGIGNWKNEFKEWRDKGVLCGISVKIDGEWVTKWDGSDTTQFEATKGGFSGSMKRAAVQWGIGRYLYNLEENWVNIGEKGDEYINTKVKVNNKEESVKGYWNIPKLPAWALPPGTKSNPEPPKQDIPRQEEQNPNQEKKPSSVQEKPGPITAEQVGTIKTLVLQFAGFYPDKKDVDVYAALKIVSLPKLNTQQADAAIEKLNKWIASFKAGEEKKGA